MGDVATRSACFLSRSAAAKCGSFLPSLTLALAHTLLPVYYIEWVSSYSGA